MACTNMSIYTKSDIQLSDNSLIDAISQLGEVIKKKDNMLSVKLLTNLNTYNDKQMAQMLNGFQHLMVNSIVQSEKNTLNMDYLLDNNRDAIKMLIMLNRMPQLSLPHRL